VSISNFLKEKKEITKDLKKLRKPKKVIRFKNKVCEFCGRNRFNVVYRMNSDKILAYKCDYCGNSIFVKEKAKKGVKKETKQPGENTEFKCPVGGIEKCVSEACSFYNICKLIKK